MASGDLISRIYSSFRGVDFRGEEINLVRSPDSLNVWRNYKKTEGIETRPGMVKVTSEGETELLDENNEDFIANRRTIYGIYFYNDEMILHCDNSLYKVVNGIASTIYDGVVEAAKSDAFVFNNLLYFKDKTHFLQYDGTKFKNATVNAHIPTTTIGRKSGAENGGTVLEDVNLLSDCRINTFVGGATDSETENEIFYFDVPEIDDAFSFPKAPDVSGLTLLETMYKLAEYEKIIEEYTLIQKKILLNITINGKPIFEEDGDDVKLVKFKNEDDEEFDYGVYFYALVKKVDGTTEERRFIVQSLFDAEYQPIELADGEEIMGLSNKVRIKPAPPAPLTDGQDNVSIAFKKVSDRSKILNCTLLQVFDNRVFFSGNPDFPNMMWHSSLNDPTYCSDLDYYNEGLDFAKVKGMVAGNNALWVFKEPSQANTSIFYHVPSNDLEYGKIYPNTHSNISAGCVGKAINFNDDIVFFSDKGMEGISGDITSEQVVAHRSSLVDRLMTAEPGYKDMLLEEWEGYLLVIIGKKVYLADSRAMFSNENHGEYEWFMWELAKEITCARVHKGTLYLGTKGGLYALTNFDGALTDGTDEPIESYWVTPKDKFKHPQYLKTTNKRGCVVEATGDITVYVKTEKKDEKFEDNELGTFMDIVDYFVCRIKRKKWKDIQLKFSSKTRFSLETATLEAFVGGYTKR